MDPTKQITEEAIAMAKKWQNQANRLITAEEKDRQKQLALLMANPRDKVVLTQMIDQSFRSANHRRIADQIHYLLSSVWQVFSSSQFTLSSMNSNFNLRVMDT